MADIKNAYKTPVKLNVDAFVQPEREVASFSMSYYQSTDAEGQVTEIVRGGKINMRLKALNDGNTDLLNWMTDNALAYTGSIEFKDTTTGKSMKKLFFEDAYCVNYEEHWEDDLFDPPLAHWEEITISCKKITIARVEFKNTWELVE